jgi:hypothetical protein
MVSRAPRVPQRDVIRWMREALFVPWHLSRLEGLDGRRTAFLAAANVFLAAALATLLSTWTYLIGKGIILGPRGMDMGQDHLPPDSPVHVGVGFLLSSLLWGLLLCVLLAVCRITARGLYGSDHEGRRRAVRQARILTVWLPVWALLMLVANSALHQDLRHPASAIRARAQLRLDDPDDIRQLNTRERFLGLVLVFPALWAIGLRPPSRPGPLRRTRFVATAAVACWLSLLFVWRILPWVFISAWTG